MAGTSELMPKRQWARWVLVAAALVLVVVWRGAPSERRLVFDLKGASALRSLDVACTSEAGESSGASWSFSQTTPLVVVHRVLIGDPHVHCELHLHTDQGDVVSSRQLLMDGDEVRVSVAAELQRAIRSDTP